MQLTKNFSLSEFHCKSGKQVPAKYLQNCQILADNLQIIRNAIGCPLVVFSGYRDPIYNKKVGGVKLSQHLTASGADVKSVNHTPKELYVIVLDLMLAKKIRKGGIGLYGTFLHYDIRGTIVPFKGSY